ncbi:MAG: TlpA disulfide reductase family protein [Acidobacteriota bacterium]
MKTRLSLPTIAVVLLTLTFALVQGCGGPSYSPPAPQSDLVGGPAPDFLLPSLDGPTIGPASYAGQVVILEFWATWCVPCHKQAEILREIYDDLKSDDVAVIAVGLGEDESTVREFVVQSPFPYAVVYDEPDDLTYELGIMALPMMMVIGPDGTVTHFEPGVHEADEIRELVAEAKA